jgi:hypothetical protein
MERPRSLASLSRGLTAIRFSHDEWMARLYGDDPPVEHFPEFFRRVSDQIEDVWPRYLELASMWCSDLGFWTRQQRDTT